MVVGGVVRRPLGQARQVRGLRQGDLPHVLAEVGMGGGLHPVRAVPEVDLVEVQLQNLLLAQDLLHLQGQERLLRLALEVPLGRQEERARQLLCDGAGALTDLPGSKVRDRGPGDADKVQPPMLKEAGVLDRHQRIHQLPGDLIEWDEDPAFHEELADHLLVGRVDTGHEAGLVLVQAGYGGQVLKQVPHCDQTRHNADHDDRDGTPQQGFPDGLATL